MYEFLHYQVGDVMVENPIAISPKMLLREAEFLFETHDFNGVPVVNETQHLLGMLTKFDVLKAFCFDADTILPRYDEIMEQTIDMLMSEDVVSVEPRLPLSRLLQMLVEMQVKSLPVVEGGRLVGIIAREDVLGALRRAAIEHKPPTRMEAQS